MIDAHYWFSEHYNQNMGPDGAVWYPGKRTLDPAILLAQVPFHVGWQEYEYEYVISRSQVLRHVSHCGFFSRPSLPMLISSVPSPITSSLSSLTPKFWHFCCQVFLPPARQAMLGQRPILQPKCHKESGRLSVVYLLDLSDKWTLGNTGWSVCQTPVCWGPSPRNITLSAIYHTVSNTPSILSAIHPSKISYCQQYSQQYLQEISYCQGCMRSCPQS